ncbi:MAG: phenylalanine--tRNA ligase subunit alpha [Ardenticatenales bacterium]|nr:phenylalanine--tRNA ligase subunit alpha [Ardenticatenales bacterium]
MEIEPNPPIPNASIATIEALRSEAESALAGAADDAALAAWKGEWLGRSGRITSLLRVVGTLSAAERPAFGAAVNAASRALEAAYEAASSSRQADAMASALAAEAIDVTLPGTPPPRGRLHPSTIILRRMLDIFAEMGFQVFLSREVELDDVNFTLLNHPPHHPARDMQDTFYITGTNEQVLLRTHTSPGQIRAMGAYAPDPIRIVLPGMVYRNEKITPRSEIQFTQVEGLAVGPHITMANLRGTIDGFVHRYYGPNRRTRFRTSYFPFTEPSAEVDVSCGLCDGAGCRLCKDAGWLEILGCGMVHPNVLTNGGYDPSRVSGFAFGLGPMRAQMMAHGIDDIRHYWGNDVRFLEQFG